MREAGSNPAGTEYEPALPSRLRNISAFAVGAPTGTNSPVAVSTQFVVHVNAGDRYALFNLLPDLPP